MSSEEQRSAVSELATELDDWVYGDGADVEAVLYREKHGGTLRGSQREKMIDGIQAIYIQERMVVLFQGGRLILCSLFCALCVV